MPGSLVFLGERQQEIVRIRVMSYDSTELVEKECDKLGEALEFIQDDKITWINIDGLHDPEIINGIGNRFNIHGLLLEDILNTDHRPKFHSEDHGFIIISKMLSFGSGVERIGSDQVSILAGENYVITLQEKVGTQFDPVRYRIRNTPNKVRLIRPDYLAYALVDCLVDNYLEIVGEVGNRIEELEDEIIKRPNKQTGEKIYLHRTEMNFLRKMVNPTREITQEFMKSDASIIHSNTRAFLKDLHEHVVVLRETIDAFQVIIMDHLNMYNANLSIRANEIMKTLTIFASLFIPLTFVAGIYGMNFEIIPELSWKWGYGFFWGLVLLLGGGLFLYFRRKGWF
jgi:magnesium transporter